MHLLIFRAKYGKFLRFTRTMDLNSSPNATTLRTHYPSLLWVSNTLPNAIPELR